MISPLELFPIMFINFCKQQQKLANLRFVGRLFWGYPLAALRTITNFLSLDWSRIIRMIWAVFALFAPCFAPCLRAVCTNAEVTIRESSSTTNTAPHDVHERHRRHIKPQRCWLHYSFTSFVTRPLLPWLGPKSTATSHQTHKTHPPLTAAKRSRSCVRSVRDGS